MQGPGAVIVEKGRACYRPDLALALTLAIAAVHIALVWGQTTFGKDAGRWRNEVERFVRGQIPYRDFAWPFPPMSLWVLGWIQKVLGDNTLITFGACAILTLLIAALYWKYCSQLLTDRITIVTVSLLGMVLAFSYAQIESDPLPAGMYTPAAPIGFLFLLFALCAWISGSNALVGLACGLAIITKQDFWFPAGVILMGCLAKGRSRGWVASLAAGAVVLVAIAVIVTQSGWAVFPQVVTGYGRAPLQAARHFPSWERLSAQIAALGFIAGVACLALRRFGIAVLALGISVALAGAVFGGAASAHGARTTLVRQQLPLLLPLAFLIWSIRRGEKDLVWLFGVAMATRIRRGFEYTEWYALLLELPVYVLILYRMKAQRAIPLLAGAVGLIAIAAYWEFGTGPLTSEYRYQDRQWVQTARGPVNWSRQDARFYSAIKAAIGEERAPLFVLGYTGGFNYYLDRPNPSPSDGEMLFSGLDDRQLVARIRAARPILLERQLTDNIRMPNGASLTSWQLLTSQNYIEATERPLFRQISAGCERSAVEHSVPPYWIFHCP
jgi:hypothetical protein